MLISFLTLADPSSLGAPGCDVVGAGAEGVAILPASGPTRPEDVVGLAPAGVDPDVAVVGAGVGLGAGAAGADGEAPALPCLSNDTVEPDVTPVSPPGLPVMPVSLATVPGVLGIAGEAPLSPGLSAGPDFAFADCALSIAENDLPVATPCVPGVDAAGVDAALLSARAPE